MLGQRTGWGTAPGGAGTPSAPATGNEATEGVGFGLSIGLKSTRVWIWVWVWV